jgi:NADH pyrophosphatase NudC (nudix superfamily)
MDGISVVIKKDNKYLMLQQSKKKPFSLKWMAVSGEIEKGETPEEAVIRETGEETSLDIEIVGKIITLTADYKTEKLHFFIANWKGGEVKIDPREAIAFGWFTYEEILKLDLMNVTKIFFGKYFKPF